VIEHGLNSGLINRPPKFPNLCSFCCDFYSIAITATLANVRTSQKICISVTQIRAHVLRVYIFRPEQRALFFPSVSRFTSWLKPIIYNWNLYNIPSNIFLHTIKQNMVSRISCERIKLHYDYMWEISKQFWLAGTYSCTQPTCS
jgi:hypothetical protein